MAKPAQESKRSEFFLGRVGRLARYKDGVFVGAWEAHERECLGGARERVLKGALWKGALWKVCEERERAPRRVDRVEEWRESRRRQGTEPRATRASEPTVRAGTSSEAVALRDDAEREVATPFLFSFMGFV